MNAAADARSTARVGILETFFGAILWGSACGGLAFAGLWRLDRLESFHLLPLLIVYSAGAAIAWIVSVACLRMLHRRLSNRHLRFLVAMFGLAVATIAFTAFAFALDYRTFYARWHAEILSKDWILQQLFTTASATYQFLVIGLRLYLPLGPLLLLAATPVLMRTTR